MSGVSARPFARSTVRELEQLFTASPHDRALLASIAQELGFRSTPIAKSLLARVGVALAQAKATKVAAGAGTPAVKPAVGGAAAVRAGSAHGNTGVTEPKPSNEVSAAYERLRSTFTEEGELLARWGMTPSLPRVLQDLVVEKWRSILRDGNTADGRTLTELERDMARVAVIRNKGKTLHVR